VVFLLFLGQISAVETTLQLVAFNIPYPPDYGGVIDIFYKLKALSECGVSIHLHCFEYNRPQASELEKYCARVYYYPRKKGLLYQFSAKPYIVVTRNDRQLLHKLAANQAPIIFEGLHTCYFLNHESLKNRVRLVRTHNVEHEYYLNLGKVESNVFRKLFFRIEACKLRQYENVLKNADHLLSISPNDNLYFDRKFGNSHFSPAFHPFNEIKSKEGKGDYILFHGNLSVAENRQAVNFLIQHVFPKIQQKVIIAGKNPSAEFAKKIQSLPHVQLIANPEGQQMDEIISHAHICLLPTFQDTGLKLKLLASLFSGRFCIANTPMVHKTGLEHLCRLADTSEEMINCINQLWDKEFTSEEIEKRRIILEDDFSNKRNALKIIQIIRNSNVS
jgi:hypothetical protein